VAQLAGRRKAAMFDFGNNGALSVHCRANLEALRFGQAGADRAARREDAVREASQFQRPRRSAERDKLA
jgi:hypothetical protein